MLHTFHMVLFGLVFTFIISCLQYYIWRRLIKNTLLRAPYWHIATGVIILLTLSAPLTMIFARTVSADTARILSFVPLMWMGIMLLAVCTLIFIDLLFLGRKLIHWKLRPADAPENPTRRTTLKRIAAASTLGISGSLTGFSVYNAKQAPTVVRQSISLNKFPKSLNGLTIAQISDIHVGLTIGRDWIKCIAEQVAALQPDIIVITGDLVDGYVETLAPQIDPLFSLHAPHGIFFVTGNHEYYFNARQWIDLLKRKNITVLENSNVQIGSDNERFVLAGINDYQGARMPDSMGPDLHRALAGRTSRQEVILLCHQPKIIFEAAESDVGLVLSGHTHGGQIWPFNFLVRLQQPYIKGLITGHGRTQMYINQGTGYWGPPMRLLTECEITLFTLSKGK